MEPEMIGLFVSLGFNALFFCLLVGAASSVSSLKEEIEELEGKLDEKEKVLRDIESLLLERENVS